MLPGPSDNVFVGDLPVVLSQDEVTAIFSAYGTVLQTKLLPPKGDKASALVRFGSVEEAQWFVETLHGNIPEGLETPICARFANGPGGGGAPGVKGKGKGGKSPSPYQNPFQQYQDPNQYAMMSMMGMTGMMGGGMPGKGGAKGSAGSFKDLFRAARDNGVLSKDMVPPECQVYINNLPADTTDKNLYQLFSQFGALAPTGCTAMVNEDGTCKGFGFVDFLDPLTAQTAIAALNGLTTATGHMINVKLKNVRTGDDAATPAKGKGKGKGK